MAKKGKKETVSAVGAKTTISISKKLLRPLKLKAIEEDKTLSQVIAEAIAAFCDMELEETPKAKRGRPPGSGKKAKAGSGKKGKKVVEEEEEEDEEEEEEEEDEDEDEDDDEDDDD